MLHVKTTDDDDGGCQVCDECDWTPGHDCPCDCDCYDRTARGEQLDYLTRYGFRTTP